MRPDSLIQVTPEVSAAADGQVSIDVDAGMAVDIQIPADLLDEYERARNAQHTYRPHVQPADTIPIEIPRTTAADTVYDIDADLGHAVAATYSTAGVDIDALTIAVPPPPPSWEEGLQGTLRHTTAGDNSGIMTIITTMFVLMMMSYRHCRRLFSTLIGELLGMRRRANVFDEHTSNETQAMGLMALQWSVYTGLLLYSYMAWKHQLNVADTFTDTLSLIGLTAVYYMFQLVAYAVVGYTFTTEARSRHFVQGFTSSQSLLGFLLIVPALVAIFYPEAAEQMIILGAGLYGLARIIFIIKGFRIFYHKFSSLLYFILYLCTLEIIPLFVVYKLALLLVNSNL